MKRPWSGVRLGTWEGDRNERGCRIHWTFTLAAARLKLKKGGVVNRRLTAH